MSEIDQNQPIGKKASKKRQSAKKQAPKAVEQPIELESTIAQPVLQNPIEQQAKPLKVTLKNRLEREGRWNEAEQVRNELMRHARTVLKLPKDTAQDWTYDELNRRYPPIEPPKDQQTTNETTQIDQQTPQELPNYQHDDNNARIDNGQNQAKNDKDQDGTIAGGDSLTITGKRRKLENTEGYGNSRPPARDTVIGIAKIPTSWPSLPANASLGEEIQWVQANRMRVVVEKPEGIRVYLKRSLSPAPSHAALGWLETSIRAYTKYCEIAAKAANSVEDVRDMVRRERLKIEEVRSLLAEMLE